MLSVAPPPPRLEDYRAGKQLIAGLGVATILPDFDFETYSEAGYIWDDEAQKWSGPPGAPGATKGLPVVGAEPYAAHPTCDIIWLAYDLKDGLGKRRWHPGQPYPQDLLQHVAAGRLLEAWNVAFERWIWEHVCVPRYGWPPLQEHQVRCAMAKARASSLPGKLGATGEVLRLPVRKDERGATLMKRLSMPRNPTKADPRRRILPIYEQREFLSQILAHEVVEYAKAAPELDQPRRLTKVATAVRKYAEILAQDWQDTLDYGEYNETDIATEAEASSRIPDLEGEELQWWTIHERINRRGVHIDRAGVENCIAVIEQAFQQYNGELQQITGIDAASKVAQLVAWLHGRGVHLDGLDEDQVEAALKLQLPPDCRRVLEIRAAVGSASVKKLFAIRNRLSADDRLRDLYVYYGARTGRSTGEGPQPTNLPKAGPDTIRCGCGHHYGLHLSACPWCRMPKAPDASKVEWNPAVAEDALLIMTRRSLQLVEHVFGNALLTVAGCLRALFDAAPGHDLISTDYNSIEAVGLAMISGEQWRIEVFRSHGKIYETSASMMYRVPFAEFAEHRKRTGQHHPLRQKGKIGELAFGYQGWLGAAKAFEMPGTDDEIKEDILAWRRASPAVEWLWGGQQRGKAANVVNNATLPDYTGAVDDRLLWLKSTGKRERWEEYYFGVEGMAIQAVLNPGQWFDVSRLDGTHSGVSFMRKGEALYCRIPSGRVLTYHFPQLMRNDRGEWALSYEGNNTNPKNGPVGWIRMPTWGGRLVENIVQATCRDLLRFACINLEAAGYGVVLHVYDEIVAEVREGWGSIEEFEAIVTRKPAWATDWVVKAPDGYRAKRYRKG